jgi:hypothetical protein
VDLKYRWQGLSWNSTAIWSCDDYAGGLLIIASLQPNVELSGSKLPWHAIDSSNWIELHVADMTCSKALAELHAPVNLHSLSLRISRC